MPYPARAAAWDLRVLRAVPFAAVCTLVAAAGHSAASGGGVPVPALVAGFTVVCVLAALLGGRERSMAAISGALAAGQLTLHWLFHASQALMARGGAGMPGMAAGDSGRPTVPGTAGGVLCPEHYAGAPAGPAPSAYGGAAAAPWWHALLPGMSPLMIAGHLVAAVVAGWWLRRGEAALWRLVRLTTYAVRAHAAPLRTVLAVAGALLRGLPGISPRRSVRAFAAERGGWRLPVPAALRHSVVRRGPPAAYAI